MAAVDLFAPGTLVYFVSVGEAQGWQPNKVYEGRLVTRNRNNVIVDFSDGNPPMSLPIHLLQRDYSIIVNGKQITVNQAILKLIHDKQQGTSSSEELGNIIEITAAANQMLLFGNVPLDAFQQDEAAEQMLPFGNDMTDRQAADMLANMKKGGYRRKRTRRTKRHNRKSRRR